MKKWILPIVSALVVIVFSACVSDQPQTTTTTTRSSTATMNRPTQVVAPPQPSYNNGSMSRGGGM